VSDLALVAIGLALAALFGGAAIFLSYRLGGTAERAAVERADEEIKDAQLAAASRRPANRAELAQRLRDDF
jgi:hypothetical protein